MANPKLYKIRMTKGSGRFGGSEPRTYDSSVGTLPDLIKAYGYTLEVGQSWQHEKGNKKINRNPKSIKTLVSNLYNAKNNAAADGYSGCRFEELTVSKEEKDAYWAEQSEVA